MIDIWYKLIIIETIQTKLPACLPIQAWKSREPSESQRYGQLSKQERASTFQQVSIPR